VLHLRRWSGVVVPFAVTDDDTILRAKIVDKEGQPPLSPTLSLQKLGLRGSGGGTSTLERLPDQFIELILRRGKGISPATLARLCGVSSALNIAVQGKQFASLWSEHCLRQGWPLTARTCRGFARRAGLRHAVRQEVERLATFLPSRAPFGDRASLAALQETDAPATCVVGAPEVSGWPAGMPA